MIMPSDYATIENMSEEEFLQHLKRQNGDKRVWLAVLKRLADTKDTDGFLHDWNALGLAGNEHARQWAKELLQERRENQGKELTDAERKYMGLTFEQ